jgi:glycerol kinase
MLLDLKLLSWSDDMLRMFHIPPALLPEVRTSAGDFGTTVREILGAPIPIRGVAGDQQAALVGQACFRPGEAKNTYGTGCFLLMNTGEKPIASTAGLVTTVAYQVGKEKACYALEGSIAVTGALVQWLRDNLGMIASSGEVEKLAREVEDNGGVFFVPAFSGLYAPHWNERARGTIVGLTRYVTRAHIARAVLEATAYQTREVLGAMAQDSSISIPELRVDGGMVGNELLMQFQADILDVPVVRPKITETTALGAAYAAGLAVGYWRNRDDLVSNWAVDKRWKPQMADERRRALYNSWQRAVSRSLDWIEE